MAHLIAAVVARKGPLVGKTAAEVGFRTRYGAAVIAVHRDGTRVQDLPGKTDAIFSSCQLTDHPLTFALVLLFVSGNIKL